MTRIAVLVSGGGTNLQKLIDCHHSLSGEIVCVVSSNPNAYAMERARAAGIPVIMHRKTKRITREEYTCQLIDLLAAHSVDLVVFCGFLVILDEAFIQAYPNRILNIHPSLLPAFGGVGCYGIYVHEMALARGVKVTGATVHFVNEIVDDGPIVLQKSVEVLQDDTPATLQKRVMEMAEWVILPLAVRLFCEGRLLVENNIVHIQEA